MCVQTAWQHSGTPGRCPGGYQGCTLKKKQFMRLKNNFKSKKNRCTGFHYQYCLQAAALPFFNNIYIFHILLDTQFLWPWQTWLVFMQSEMYSHSWCTRSHPGNMGDSGFVIFWWFNDSLCEVCVFVILLMKIGGIYWICS